MAKNECHNFKERNTVYHRFNEGIGVSVCVSANKEMLLHPTNRWLQRLAAPDERLPHIEMLQLGHGLLGQDRQSETIQTELPLFSQTHTKETNRLRLLIFIQLLPAISFVRW